MVMMLLVTYGEPVRLTQASRDICEAMTVYWASMMGANINQLRNYDSVSGEISYFILILFRKVPVIQQSSQYLLL